MTKSEGDRVRTTGTDWDRLGLLEATRDLLGPTRIAWDSLRQSRTV